MNIDKYLMAEWVPALGCTEPASIAYAGLIATSQLDERPQQIILKVDPRIYKNCYAVGIPHSGHKTGIKWAAAIGAFLKKKELGLQCFEETNAAILKSAQKLIKKNRIKIVIDKLKEKLFIEFTVIGGRNSARCVIEGSHTNVTLVSRNNKIIYRSRNSLHSSAQERARKWAASRSLDQLIKLARALSMAQRKAIISGALQNIMIARHGLKLLPKTFFNIRKTDVNARITALVGAGVYARMWGEPFPVMSVAGSGNKGIVICVPLITLKDRWHIPQRKIEEALLIAMLVTSKTTCELGTLSAVCGCSNAAGVGLACAIVYLKGGGQREMSFAINNMVGNITGMICDGAKIGCAMKTMTSVDAAFRSAALAMSGIGIPVEDGIVGKDGSESLANMGLIAKRGMVKTDEEILKIMEKKL
ncbi:MAG: L-serine ammonia-lyase, iron-sulfur-dependent, subunit alpha [Verrucomicrobia bacterium]|nr:L-serine ammonia-lyase, iron-sulfur-dependent, subunit alpha [Verrucomicrobiota bacterium]MCG2681813.1 L-serine ammonia-lyase, iron-sulfur-dependent, subunit alpha [Kiritimatiellia bacterium]MBU4247294.1 L-serine ammonia-lyase, iron-sulfur-dependent, subunit alpha [Verrucomicrobiota bacterium]MBU4289910.1 L-serine ammonia-lyase, iron-sulfur-dependent, subunit alpha [Verrucomicrobiota bacterium]MBU4428906.1 L-serine ammonia-lyase, iron-sulfur-dependent, subunit alpha [Verrucomicrobiota bacter